MTWHDDAACRDKPTRWWFPEGNESPAHAIKVCRGCPVRVDCLADAYRYDVHHGIWGGLDPDARRRLRLTIAHPTWERLKEIAS